jgi:hypothetical protein
MINKEKLSFLEALLDGLTIVKKQCYSADTGLGDFFKGK